MKKNSAGFALMEYVGMMVVLLPVAVMFIALFGYLNTARTYRKIIDTAASANNISIGGYSNKDSGSVTFVNAAKGSEIENMHAYIDSQLKAQGKTKYSIVVALIEQPITPLTSASGVSHWESFAKTGAASIIQKKSSGSYAFSDATLLQNAALSSGTTVQRVKLSGSIYRVAVGVEYDSKNDFTGLVLSNVGLDTEILEYRSITPRGDLVWQ